MHSRALLSKTSLIELGSLKYRFILTDYVETSMYEQQRREIIVATYPGLHSQSPLIPMPSKTKVLLKIGEWHFTDIVGHGSSGPVYRGDRASGTPATVAIKQLTLAEDGPTKLSTLQTLESIIMKKPGPASIRRLVDWYPRRKNMHDRFEQHLFMLSPLCEFTLDMHQVWTSDHIEGHGENRCLPSPTALIFKDVLEGLAWLHEHGWIHGSMSDRNIGLKWCHEAGRLKSYILGLSRMERPTSGSLPPLLGFAGSMNWIAPECEEEYHNNKADVWSAGVLGVYLLKGGHHPWDLDADLLQRKERQNEVGSETEVDDFFKKRYDIVLSWLLEGSSGSQRTGELYGKTYPS